MKTYTGTVKNGVIVLESGSLPEGTRVTVNTVSVPDEIRDFREGLQKFVGSLTGDPGDLARNHDHYLHGRPRR